MKKQFGALFLSLVMVIGCSSTALAAEVGIERNTFSEKAGEVVWITNSDIDTFALFGSSRISQKRLQ